MNDQASPGAYAVTHDGWGELVLSRPARRNAIVGPMVGEMRAALASLFAAKARVIVLRGDGGSFGSGLDVDRVGRPAMASCCVQLRSRQLRRNA
jgi:enoyl-CoA hydratase/carnithine racemase